MSLVTATTAADPLGDEKPYFPKRRGPKSKVAKRAKAASDRMFCRHMEALQKIEMAGGEAADDITEEAREFLQKYTSSHSATVLRDRGNVVPTIPN
eukprot:5595314-Pyramimonas_sp.AAC.1